MKQPTNEDVRKALLGSVAKWYRIAYEGGEDIGGANCPLCNLFIGNFRGCGGCPVAVDTGMESCRGSPYGAWRRACKNGLVHDPKSRDAAMEELIYLRGLYVKFFVDGVSL